VSWSVLGNILMNTTSLRSNQTIQRINNVALALWKIHSGKKTKTALPA